MKGKRTSKNCKDHFGSRRKKGREDTNIQEIS